MTVLVICATIVVVAVIVAVSLERHRRFWADRNIDAMRVELAESKALATKAQEDAKEVLARMTRWETDNAFRR